MAIPDYAEQARQQREAEAERERQQQIRRVKFIVRVVGLVVGALIVLSLLLGCYYTVNQDQRAIVTRWGRAVRVTGPGIHPKTPFVEGVDKFYIGVRAVEWAHYREAKDDSRMESYSHDQQAVHLSIKVTYRLKPDEKSLVDFFTDYQTIDRYNSNVIYPRTYEAVKSVFGLYTAAEAVQQRGKLNKEIEEGVRTLVAGTPVLLDGVQIQDIKFDPAYERAVNDRMQAEVEVSKVTQNLERERKTAEITVVRANAEATSTLAKAKAQAEATKINGDASAIRAKGGALRDNPSLVSLTAAERWNGVLPETMVPGGAVPFIGVK